jgi:hypothetical protein
MQQSIGEFNLVRRFEFYYKEWSMRLRWGCIVARTQSKHQSEDLPVMENTAAINIGLMSME